MTHATALPRLTGRQRDVLERIAAGETNIEIATALGIGFETVKMHVSDVLAELGVDSREDAARVWKERPGPVRRTLQALAPVFSIKSAGAITAGAALVSGAMVFALAQYSGSTGRAAAPDPGPEASTLSSTASITGDPTGIQVIVPLPPGTATDSLTAYLWIDGRRQFAWPGGDAPAGFFSFVSEDLPNQPADVRIEVVRWQTNRDTVPITSETVRWNGYTNPVTPVLLPAEPTAPLGDFTIRLLEVFETPDRIGVRWQAEGLLGHNELPRDFSSLLDSRGSALKNFGSFARGQVDGAPTRVLSVFERGSGPVTFTLTFEAKDIPWLTDEQRAQIEATGALSASITIDLP